MKIFPTILACLALCFRPSAASAQFPLENDPSIAAGTVTRVGKDGTALTAGSQLTLRWRPTDLPGGASAREMRPVRWYAGAWHPLTALVTTDDSLVVRITAGGTYAVRWSGPTEPCVDPANREVDFRIGSWDYRATGYDPGKSTVVASPNRCALYDDYKDVNGGESHSFMKYDAAIRRWYITTYDPGGRSVMQGTAWRDSVAFYHSPSDREVYRKQGDDSVAFSGERSLDGGNSWKPWVTALYRRARSN